MATVRDDAGQHRYEIVVDDVVAGVAEYHDHAGRRTFTHTEIDAAYEGQGLGSQLVRGALDGARARGLEVVPVCPFVRDYIDGHRDDYLDLVSGPMRVKCGFETGR